MTMTIIISIWLVFFLGFYGANIFYVFKYIKYYNLKDILKALVFAFLMLTSNAGLAFFLLVLK